MACWVTHAVLASNTLFYLRVEKILSVLNCCSVVFRILFLLRGCVHLEGGFTKETCSSSAVFITEFQAKVC